MRQVGGCPTNSPMGRTARLIKNAVYSPALSMVFLFSHLPERYDVRVHPKNAYRKIIRLFAKVIAITIENIKENTKDASAKRTILIIIPYIKIGIIYISPSICSGANCSKTNARDLTIMTTKTVNRKQKMRSF
jgi:hypothetical protein